MHDARQRALFVGAFPNVQRQHSFHTHKIDRLQEDVDMIGHDAKGDEMILALVVVVEIAPDHCCHPWPSQIVALAAPIEISVHGREQPFMREQAPVARFPGLVVFTGEPTKVLLLQLLENRRGNGAGKTVGDEVGGAGDVPVRQVAPRDDFVRWHDDRGRMKRWSGEDSVSFAIGDGQPRFAAKQVLVLP
jgi:hypothetical protein